jgi:dTDP-4-amino-4,6-dideoxygalactose transaminase
MYKPLFNPYTIVEMFEAEVANYTGAPFAVSIDSCTNALFLCCKYLGVDEVRIPKLTYLSVPMSIIQAGGYPRFTNETWYGIYQLKPYPIIDAARRFTSGMYIKHNFMCLSFHIKKTLKIGKGGMILTDDEKAADWFRIMRYEGRSKLSIKVDPVTEMGWNMYMTPEEAARGLFLMQDINLHNPDVEQEEYRDLTTFPIFKEKQYYDTWNSSSTGLQ